MARSFSEPSRLYLPGAHTVGSIDGLANVNISYLEFTMTVGADWPTDRTMPVVKVILAWDTGGDGFWTYNGGLTNRDGTPRTLITEPLPLQTESDGAGGMRKRPIGGATFKLEVYQPITTAITLRAV